MKIRITQDVPRNARLTKGNVVDAEPVTSHSEVMRVKDFAAFENGALVRGWELILKGEEIEALLRESTSFPPLHPSFPRKRKPMVNR